jgi:flagellar hook-basal body complex protein FliE
MKAGGIDASRIESMLAQLKAAAQRPQADAASGLASAAGIQNTQSIGQGVSQVTGKINFSDALKASLNQVNKVQVEAEQLGKSFAMGDDSVSLSDVMIAGQKANISFQATVQVRNKLVSAYHDIMNMQV